MHWLLGLENVQHSDKPFGGLCIVFGGDFKQILLVIVKSSCDQIVGACNQRSHLWGSVKLLKLTQNMWLNTLEEAERNFAKWQLDIGYGKHTDETGTTTLPDHFKCPENAIASLISAIYPGIMNFLIFLMTTLLHVQSSQAGMMMWMISMRRCCQIFLERRRTYFSSYICTWNQGYLKQ